MRTFLLLICIGMWCAVAGQRDCSSSDYLQSEIASNPLLPQKMAAIEGFIQKQVSSSSRYLRTTESTIIKVPVVVHVLYNTADQNISDAQINSQIEALNKDFRRRNSDTVNTPNRFQPFAADVQIEFYLATADPMGRATKGIVRKKTNVTSWMSDDKIKFNSEGGDNAWDSKSYLNIWVGNLKSGLGYATAPGTEAGKDGLVIKYSAFGTVNTAAPYHLGRTAVHEIGHWLGLKHIWGDTYCGDDMVGDTPPQSGYTAGCPTSFRTSCSNGTLGDMYMNYMDFTNDACTNMFTEGQKQRMRALFNNGGPRASLLLSKGLNQPWLEEAPVPGPEVKEAKLYPNPAIDEITLNFENDDSWIGKNVQLINVNGVVLQTLSITAKSLKISLHGLRSGMYFVKGENADKKFIQKFIKL